VLLDDHEHLVMAVAVLVRPAGRAVTRQGTGHRTDVGVPALVQHPQARHPDRLAPDPVLLGSHEPLVMAVAVLVRPAGHAVTRRRARHLGDAGPPAPVQRPRAGYLDRPAP